MQTLRQDLERATSPETSTPPLALLAFKTTVVIGWLISAFADRAALE